MFQLWVSSCVSFSVLLSRRTQMSSPGPAHPHWPPTWHTASLNETAWHAGICCPSCCPLPPLFTSAVSPSSERVESSPPGPGRWTGSERTGRTRRRHSGCPFPSHPVPAPRSAEGRTVPPPSGQCRPPERCPAAEHAGSLASRCQARCRKQCPCRW